jgi:hypothetical protein
MDPAQSIGKYFRCTLDPGGTVQDRKTLDRGVKRGSGAHWSINTTLSDALGGGVGQPWNFTFLKYWAGAITRCTIGTGGVLTGPMSGCILCRFTNTGGVSVAHIGTDMTPTHPNTIAVKADWTRYIRSKPAGNFVGRKPTEVIKDLDVFAEASTGKLQPPTGYQVWGYFRTADAWALLIHRGANGVNQIIRARPMALLPWATIPGGW